MYYVSMRILMVIALIVSGCSGDRYLRGSVEDSEDGRTYLMIVDDNGGFCEIYIDDKPWPHEIGEAGVIEPGQHKISCGGDLWFEIPEGKVFKFDYWGP